MRPRAPLHHAARHRLTGQDGAEQVAVQHRAHVLLANVDGVVRIGLAAGRGDIAAGIVDEDVDRPERFARAVATTRSMSRALGQVAEHADGAHAVLARPPLPRPPSAWCLRHIPPGRSRACRGSRRRRRGWRAARRRRGRARVRRRSPARPCPLAAERRRVSHDVLLNRGSISLPRDRGRWREPGPGTSARQACAAPAPACPGSRTPPWRLRRSGSAGCR